MELEPRLAGWLYWSVKSLNVKQAVVLRNFPRSTHERMPPASPYERHLKTPGQWGVKPPGKLKYELSRDVTWADIKSCMVELFLNGGGTLDDFVAGKPVQSHW